MIQRILQIGADQWLRGLSPSRYYNGGAALYQAKGIDLFRLPGRLTAGLGADVLLTATSTVPLSGEIRCFAYKPGYPTIYGYGNDGNIYEIPATGAPIVLSNTCTNGQGQGLEFYGGKLVYSQATRIGSFNWTLWDNIGICPAGSLTTSLHHPLKVGADKNLYVGNVNKLAEWDGSTFDSSRLTFDSYYTITALESDGFYLVIGAEGVVSGAPGGNKNIVTVFFWDMVSNQVNRVWTLPDANALFDLQYKDGFIYAFCGNILYECSFDSPPKRALLKTGMHFGNKYGEISGIMNNVLYFPEVNDGTINSYGAPQHDLSPIVQSPNKVAITGASAEITALATYQTFGIMYVCTDEHKLFAIRNNPAVGVTGTSPLIDLGRNWKLHYLKVTTDPLASGDSLTLSLKSSASGSELLTATTFTYSSDGAKVSKKLPIGGDIVDQIQFAVTFTAGVVAVRKIELYGEPLPEEYAEC